jgi:hypothetical protein
MAAKMDDDMGAISHLPPLMDVSGATNPAAAHVTCFSNALEGQSFLNQTAAPQVAAAATDPNLGLASSSPFLSSFAQYGSLHHGGVSLVQLLESSGGLPDTPKHQQQPAPRSKGGERLSASQDTGLTYDVHPEISSSGQRFDHEQLWGY